MHMKTNLKMLRSEIYNVFIYTSQRYGPYSSVSVQPRHNTTFIHNSIHIEATNVYNMMLHMYFRDVFPLPELCDIYHIDMTAA